MEAYRINSHLKTSMLFVLTAIFVVGGAFLVLRMSGPVFRDNVVDAVNESPRSSEEFVYEAIGDSITFGRKFNFTLDEFDRPKRIAKTFQGWPELLGDMLTEEAGSKIVVLNEGHPGDRLTKVTYDRIPALVSDKPKADAALLMIGTIDSGSLETSPSGIGCTGTECDGTLKSQLLETIVELQGHGREFVHIALLPPVWGPDYESLYDDPLSMEATRNQFIMEYNRMIVREIANQPGVKLGPDFFSCFLGSDLDRSDLFVDHLHPNALGQLVMASLWHDAIARQDRVFTGGGCRSPVYTLSIQDPVRYRHKQDVLVEGDKYYTDQSHTLTNIPDELLNGIWVLQADADKANRQTEFLTFDVGDEPVTVFIAYDPAGVPPVSQSHEFAPASLSGELAVSDPMVGAFDVVQAGDVSGAVSVGGNKSGDNGALQQAYVVIVVP